MECWDENMFRFLLPRIYQIVCAFNEKYCNKIRAYYSHNEEKVRSMAIIGNNEIRMANLCVAVCRRVNGVSNLHGDILKRIYLIVRIVSFHRNILRSQMGSHTDVGLGLQIRDFIIWRKNI